MSMEYIAQEEGTETERSKETEEEKKYNNDEADKSTAQTGKKD